MAMTPEQEAADKARILKRLQAAAGSAVFSFATPEEIRQAVEAGVAEAEALVAAQRAAATYAA